MSRQSPHLAQRIAGKISALRRRYPRLQTGEALTAYAHLLLTRELLQEALLAGKLEAQRLRAVTEVQRMILDAGRSLGIIKAAPKAGAKAEAVRTPEDEKLDRMIYGNRGRP